MELLAQMNGEAEREREQEREVRLKFFPII